MMNHIQRVNLADWTECKSPSGDASFYYIYENIFHVVEGSDRDYEVEWSACRDSRIVVPEAISVRKLGFRNGDKVFLAFENIKSNKIRFSYQSQGPERISIRYSLKRNYPDETVTELDTPGNKQVALVWIVSLVSG